AQSHSGRSGVTVVSLAFTGAVQLLSEKQRESLAQEAVGRTLDLAELQAIADRATQLVQDNGRLLAFAYLPPQDVTEGVVRVALAEGVVESWQFDLGAGARIRPERLTAIAHGAARPS